MLSNLRKTAVVTVAAGAVAALVAAPAHASVASAQLRFCNNKTWTEWADLSAEADGV
ncbi:hypothetical protein [Saccharothrix sp. ALI-22-I]|uniref:hypothetical protein n=1 Tax=Saccharothrix sp. ALI-22-I TaxID=1933778 RepID=UPI0015C3FE18|nr:hypothetical protein [Saccharothrix sp. ALI-22-I]